ncbi:hypothetical protein Pint_19425 [Pistacia integerrima]|uniref:Uncharacterized protein n=1 Tax=Pistacia integerrima TaxID=434235 RepID=A0ACC0YX03_9ROSI|nr:hypothetical protein Pint_19425 [Pistacia integerrima]
MASKAFLLFSFVILLLSLLSHSVLADNTNDKKQSPFEFINHLQALPRNLKHANDDDFDELLESAIKTYQLNYHLKATGVLDAKTVSKMTMPRCGMADVVNGNTRMRSGHKRQNASSHFHAVAHYEFFPGNPKWPANKYHLTYAFLARTPADAMNPVSKAFTTWAGNTHFRFSRSQDIGNADITISFHSGNHGDGSPFDGQGGVIAHAFAPDDGRFLYDADERWSVGAAQGAFGLETVALHEIGHLLGLGHSSVEGAIMFPSISAGVTKGLHGDDIQGIRALYNICIVILIPLCVCLLISFIFSRFFSSKTRNTRKLPPGPPTLHLIANFLWHRKSFFELGKIVSDLRKRYGPIITIKIGSEPTIFITNNTLAYQALVLNGAIFADRPKTTFADRLFPNKRKGVSLFPYGSTWRSLRRNLTGTSGVLHPSRLISCSHIRKRVLDNLIHRLKQDSEHEGGIHVVDRFTAREKMKQGENKGENIDQFVSYVNTLLELQVPDENKKFEEGDIVSLSDEFISAGTDTTTTALQWIMANVVKYPRIQEKILAEMRGLRRHPPTYQAATPHAVTEDTELGGYLIPKGTTVNFLIADMGRDPNVWKDPVEFKPKRFLFSHGEESFDITGSREIKMMPFGAGRRICPGLGFAILHLEYFVANLIWHFEWSAVDGEDIDLSEKIDITIKMKNPLRVHLSSR